MYDHPSVSVQEEPERTALTKSSMAHDIEKWTGH